MTKAARRLLRPFTLAIAILLLSGSALIGSPGRARADSYVPISGAGSTWSQNALNQWISDVSQYGMRVNYAGTGSSDGRSQFIHGTVDFAASDIPFQTNPQDGSQPEQPAPNSWAYMPITAGGTVFMYNLHIAGQRVTNLRLSGENIMKIFSGQITMWNDPAIQIDNPQLALPARRVVPVVRSDGSGSTAQLTTWMINQFPSIWNQYCHTAGRAPACGVTSYYPTVPGMVAQAGDLGVAGYVSQNYAEGAIGYVQYSYALNSGFPSVSMLNSAGYYTQPTPQAVAVSLLNAKVDTQDVNNPQLYLTEDLTGVYTDPDPRTYPLSGYSYLILPTAQYSQGGQSFSSLKGHTLGAFAYYSMCQGQQESSRLGYSPMPINLVQASFDQIKKVPGVAVQNINIQSCNNPTFSPDGTNLLAKTAPYPPACAKKGPVQCSSGTGGAVNSPTPASKAPSAGSARTGTAVGSQGSANSSISGNSGSTTAAANGAAAALQGAAANCDPSVSTCSDSSSLLASSGNPASAQAQSIAGKSGWGGTQTLMLLAGLLTLGVVLAPGLVAEFIRRNPK